MLKQIFWTTLAMIFIATCVTLADPTTTPTSSLDGHWKWTLAIADNSIDMSADLKVDGGKITGVFLDGFDNTKYDITDGKLDGSNITFKISRPLQDSKIESTYTGKLDGDTIKGQMEFHMTDLDPTKVDWLAKRSVADSATTNPSK